MNNILKIIAENNELVTLDSGITLSGLAKIMALIGTLFAVLNAPAGISQLIGSDLSVSSSLQSLQTTMIGGGLLSSAGRMLGNTLKDAGALSTYGVGRMLGGASINKQLQNNSSVEGLNSLISNRPTLGGIEAGINNMKTSSNPGINNFVSGLMTGGLPNIAKPISEINSQNGSYSSIMTNPSYSSLEKIGRAGLRATGWGASRAYAAASNRVASFGHRGYPAGKNSMMNNLSMTNVGLNKTNFNKGENV